MERTMKLQDVLLKAMAKKISWMEAAEKAGVTDRTLRRILQQGVSSAGTWLWTDTATGEVKASIRYQVETMGSEHAVRLFRLL
jgi:hypothetical protein